MLCLIDSKSKIIFYKCFVLYIHIFFLRHTEKCYHYFFKPKRTFKKSPATVPKKNLCLHKTSVRVNVNFYLFSFHWHHAINAKSGAIKKGNISLKLCKLYLILDECTHFGIRAA